MSKQTAIGVSAYIYKTIKPYLDDKISGDIYLQNCRPLDSVFEDAVIGVIDMTATQIQEGRVRIYIYCQDINAGGGRLVPNIQRLAELGQLAEPIIELLNEGDSDYNFELYEAPQFERVVSTGVAGNVKRLNEHSLNIILQFEKITF